ncbi:YraN family protein [Rhodovibrio sodomensis]|uniref:YraN family protein n=1 Tax=Rhodovibrio sodomensis TaxID=1088 RepID=UPI001904F1C0
MKPPAARRRAAERRGRGAEAAAAWLLRLKGYRILARDLRTPVGEVDLIVRRGQVLALVEVKTRATRDQAAAAISPHQRRRIARAGEAFLARRPDLAGLDVRFDALLLAPGRWPHHVVGAWRVAEGADDRLSV